MSNSPPLLLAFLGVSLSAVVAPAWSQTEAGMSTLEEVVVTARHREENLQGVPLSITALSGDAIRDSHEATLQGLEFSVPNMVFGETGASSETFIGIRGIGDFARNIGFDTRVGVYIDGVFAGQSLAVDQGMLDVRQIEVLRGPQGTLFGKNSSSGVINILSNAPVIGELSGEWRVGGGNFRTFTGSGVTNLPLGEISAVRLSAMAQHQGGYIDNLFGGSRLMTNNSSLARARFLFKPSESLEINLSFDMRRQNNRTLFLEPDASYENSFGNPAAAPDFVVDQNADLVDETKGWGSGLTIDYKLPNDLVLTSITGYRAVDRKTGSDEDATRVFTLEARYFEDHFKHLTQEIRFASRGSERFRYVFGGFFFDQKADTDHVVALGPGFGGPPAGVDAAVQRSSVDTRNWALFANANYDLTERLTVSGGVRYTNERKDAMIRQNVFPGFGLALLIDKNLSRSENYVTEAASLKYRLSDTAAGYFTYSNGYKSGGYNVDLVRAVSDLPYQQEKVDSYELGFKSDLMSRRLRLNLAIYLAKYRNYQVFQFRFDPSNSTTALLISNAASVKTRGFEVEATALPTSRLSLDVGLGYSEATFDDFPGGAIDVSTGAPMNVAGNALPRAPKWTADATATYKFLIGSLGGRTSLTYGYRGEQFFNPDNRANARQGGYGLWNASVSFDLNDRWRVSLYGQNLGDKTYRTMRGVSFLGVPFSLFARPRTYGAEVSTRF